MINYHCIFGISQYPSIYGVRLQKATKPIESSIPFSRVYMYTLILFSVNKPKSIGGCVIEVIKSAILYGIPR